MSQSSASLVWQTAGVQAAARPARVLLLGYNGANNTGAEALLAADIEDVYAVLGRETVITVPTLNPANLRRYITESPTLRIVRMPPIFFGTLRRLVRENDLALLVEGSTYMDTWTSAMLWAYLWLTHCAAALGKPMLAYAVDAGELKSKLNRWLVRREASKSGMIIARAGAAAERLRGWGVTAPLAVTADNALNFLPNPADAGLMLRSWPEAGAGVVGLAVVDFYKFPVVMKPWGRGEDLYRWPYYFSRSTERDQAAEALARGYAALADRLFEQYGKRIALIGMEALDEPLGRRVQSYMRHPEAARVFSSLQYNASQMASLLRELDLLITSRYHACILSLAASVPQIAVGHDLRLKTIYRELDLFDEYFMDATREDLFAALDERVDRLLADPEPGRERLRKGYERHLADARRNRELLRTFVRAHGWEI